MIISFVKRLLGRDGAPPPGGFRFDLLMTALSAWFVGGIYLDGWAHNHLDSSLETFFTPWHAVMYSGFAACGLALAVTALRNKRPDRSWLSSVPDGYAASLVGAGIFAAGGAFDLVWHGLFGIEADLEALLSPAHLILALGALLIVTGPLRAAWRRPGAPQGYAWLPVALSMVFALSVLTFMSQFAHFVRGVPAGILPADAEFADVLQGRSVACYVMQSALLVGMMLLALRRWGPAIPFGVFTTLFTLNLYGMAFMTDEHRLVWAALAAGALADLKAAKLRPSADNVRSLRIFSFEVPFALVLFMMVAWSLTEGLWWSIHAWTGAAVYAGVAGLFVSYLVAPPFAPRRTAD
jgi:hypothetical protein